MTSGVKWAARDLDLTKPGGFCDTPFTYDKSFFSWGNIDGHNPKANSFVGVYDWGTDNAGTYSGTKGSILQTDIPVGEEFDAARANLGSPWRMPTTTEFAELFSNIRYIDANGDEISGDNKLTTVNGVVGLYLESTVNGNRLFFACSGYGHGHGWYGVGSYGDYWSASINSAASARYLYFGSGGVYPQDGDSRFYGFAVRPVQ